MAADFSLREGNLSKEDVDGIVTLLEKVSLPTLPPADIDPERFIELMAVDKKVLDGQLRLVLLGSVGSAVVTDRFNHKNLMDCLEQFCS